MPPETPSRGEQVVVRPSHRPKKLGARQQQMLKQTAKKTASQAGIRSQYLRLQTRALSYLPAHAKLNKVGPSAVTSYMNQAFAAAAGRRPRGGRHALLHAASINVRLAVLASTVYCMHVHVLASILATVAGRILQYMQWIRWIRCMISHAIDA